MDFGGNDPPKIHLLAVHHQIELMNGLRNSLTVQLERDQKYSTGLYNMVVNCHIQIPLVPSFTFAENRNKYDEHECVCVFVVYGIGYVLCYIGRFEHAPSQLPSQR